MTGHFFTSSLQNNKVNKKESKNAVETDGETNILSVLFADVARNPDFDQTSDHRNAQACLRILSNVAVQHHGKIVKAAGNRLVCYFPSGNDAVTAAGEMHLAAEKNVSDDSGFVLPDIRIAIHSGRVTIQGNKMTGEPVNVAARMVGLAKQRQIITTEQTLNALPPEYRKISRCIDRTTIKGKKGAFNIHELIWESAAETDNPSPDVSAAHLELRYQNQIVVVSHSRPAVTMGRKHYNDVAVDGKRISRSHASIEYRRGRFVLIDRSTNGTYLLINGKPPMKVQRFETPLHMDGIIGLAQKVRHDSPDAIHFAVKS